MQQLGLGLDVGHAPTPITVEIGGDVIRYDWGSPAELGSAAFWTDQARRLQTSTATFRIGQTLAEEVTACLLGGFGVSAAVGLAAFSALRVAVDLEETVGAAAVEQVLREPLAVAGRAQRVRYRFPRQRARRIADALRALEEIEVPTEARELRQVLCGLPGIGPKTASWIVRNHLGSDEVAIIDIHIRRAGLGIGCFLPHWALPRDYGKYEQSFLSLARIGDVRPAILDAFIWFELQRLGPLASVYGIDRC
jgi:N-glycosylase/DNA lyase